jgi:hypothetical protein
MDADSAEEPALLEKVHDVLAQELPSLQDDAPDDRENTMDEQETSHA